MSQPSPTPPQDPLVGPFLQNPGTDRMTVAWIRTGNDECSLSYAPEGGEEICVKVSPLRGIEESPDFFYEAVLTGLAPGTRYSYTLRCPGGDHSASLRTFPDNPERFNFIYYGDNKSGQKMHRDIGLLFDQHDPYFAMHSGDMTDHGAYPEYKTYLFDPIRDVIDHLPFFPGRGNHEGNGKAYRQVFSLPGGDTWYSFDLAGAHFIVLDTTGWRHEWEKPDIKRMYDWLEADLARAANSTWKIAMYHEPSFDLGWRKDDWGRKDFLPLMRRGKVDLTFSGHAHGYQRLRPMVARGENKRSPITHIISAGAGASIGNKPLDESDFLVAEARRFNYMPISIEGERLTARVLSDDDELLDEFELVKRDGQYDDSILRQTRWAEDYGKPGTLTGPYE
jgi:Calcineurin-like phosphoesterase